MRSARAALLLVTAAAMTACATQKTWVATGGSRADGVVRLSYETGGFEKPETDENQALGIALSRCKVWGYTGAMAFGGTTRTCNMRGFWSACDQWLVTKEYQCTSDKAS